MDSIQSRILLVLILGFVVKTVFDFELRPLDWISLITFGAVSFLVERVGTLEQDVTALEEKIDELEEKNG